MQCALPILVVDDYASMRTIITSLIKGFGYDDVDSAGDVVTALQMMHEKRYGLIISDVNMEPINGLQFLRSVRADHDLHDVLFLLTTASLDANLVITAKNSGVNTYLLKPFTPTQLKIKLSEVLNHQKIFVRT